MIFEASSAIEQIFEHICSLHSVWIRMREKTSSDRIDYFNVSVCLSDSDNPPAANALASPHDTSAKGEQTVQSRKKISRIDVKNLK